ncbi:sensor domain-containing protein [Mycobacterium camsae]|uniref:sensor domain-containing protein n=1 Tax=Mycobacterium gordonae TaxID=1778 RepID=UPI001F11EC95|nr:sensor domain-containing protein [Mycobacterium gordonae]
MVFAGLVRIVAVLSLAVLGTGCVSTVDGAAARTVPRSGPTTMPLSQILPGDEDIRTAVGNEMSQSPSPRTGGIELLPDGFRDNHDASPIACIGPAYPGLRVVYEKGPVRDVAVQDYWNYGLDAVASSATAAAVRLASAADAQRLFASFVAQWQSCAGTTVTMLTLDSSKTQWFSRVTGVEVHAAMLSAGIECWDTHQTPPFPVERAVAVASDVIADVSVSLRPHVETGSRATDLVKSILRKLASAN